MYKIFLDTETIDVIENVDYDILFQLSYIIYDDEDKLVTIKDTRCKPEHFNDMAIESMALMNIVPEDLENEPSIYDTEEYKFLKSFISSHNCVLIAHNAPFDINVMNRVGIDLKANCEVLDTLRLARFINDKNNLKWNQCTLQYIKYFYRLDRYTKKYAEKIGLDISTLSSHDSLYDIIDLKIMFEYLKKKFKIDIESCVELLKKPIKLMYVPFGKNKGELITSLSPNQLKYYASLDNMPDLKFSCELYDFDPPF